MKGVLSYTNEGRRMVEITVEGSDQDELIKNGQGKWREVQNSEDKAMRPASGAKPSFHFPTPSGGS